MFSRVLKSELYRISRMKSTYILLTVLMVLILLTNFIYTRIDLYGLLGFSQEDVTSIQDMGTSAEGFQESFMAGFQAGLQTSESIQDDGADSIKILGQGPFYDQDVATVFSLDVGSLYEVLLLAIFVGLYIGNIYSSGLDKNLNIFAGQRCNLFAGRMLLIAGYSFIIHLFTWITAIVSMALMGQSVMLGIDKAFVIYFFATWLLIVAFGSIVASMTHVTKSKAAGITLGIILSAGLLSTLLSVASLIIEKKFELESGFNLGNYTVTQNLAAMTLFSDGHFVLRALICAAVYFAVPYIVSLMIIRKRDIA